VVNFNHELQVTTLRDEYQAFIFIIRNYIVSHDQIDLYAEALQIPSVDYSLKQWCATFFFRKDTLPHCPLSLGCTLYTY
jgi:hypothetical protein